MNVLLKNGFNVFAKGHDPCQPAQFAQADMGRNLALSLNIVHVKGPGILLHDSVTCLTKWILWIHN